MDYLKALWVVFLFACGAFFALVTVVCKLILLVVAVVARGAEQLTMACRTGVSCVQGHNPKMTKKVSKKP